jgi:3',5'-cyclic AMP phosphodiesterase CpdA
MTRISLLHVGDIHYPDNKSPQKIDLKDAGIGKDFTASLAPVRLKSAMDSLIHVIENKTIHGVLFSGDLTSRADMDGYDSCVEYLESNLSGNAVWATSQLHVVHGNHDIARDADTSKDSWARYRATQESWKKRKLQVLHPDLVRSVEMKNGKASAWVHSLNSCMGCGEIRRLPEKVRAQIGELLDKLRISPISESDFDLIGEQLDTPAFDESHVADLGNKICGDPIGIHVLLGHHPVMPQALPRVEIYTEAINGGLMRSRLTDLPISVIYCHGHVHDDPIEVVRDASVGTDVAFISAPQFVDGFNLIELEFAVDRRSSETSYVPLGCEITRYRARRHGSLKEELPIRVPLCRPEKFDFVADDLHRTILKKLTNEPVRFRPLMQQVKQAAGQVQQMRFLDHLKHLHWHGLVEIAGRNEECDHWQIRRIGG